MAEHFSNSTAASESSTANSGSFWNNTTNAVDSTPDLIKIRDRPALNTIETETTGNLYPDYNRNILFYFILFIFT